jgi:hypothetical protein
MRVCDVATDVPNARDVIFVDTNIWLFQTYPGATTGLSPARKALIDAYLKYIKRAQSAKAAFIAFPTVALELASVIEKEEYKEQCRLQGVDPFPADPGSPHTLKARRQDAGFRKTVVSYIAQAWLETATSASVPDATLSSELCSRAAENAARDGIDTIDSLHLALMREHGISLILTDDSDFANLSEAVTLLTDNQKSLTTAAEWGLLARR